MFPQTLLLTIVIARKWIECTEFLPSSAKLLSRVAIETANISANIWDTKH